MKLRNKKTGEIYELELYAKSEYLRPHKVETNEGRPITLSELSKEYEDYEESEYYYFIDDIGNENCIANKHSDKTAKRKLVGNYFETPEEAERAVEKLKAWKRLKDARFRFVDFGYNLDEEKSNLISADGKICFELMCYEDFSEDLELLFGDEK